jgi:chitin synthase
VFWVLTNAGLAAAIENMNGMASDNATTDERTLHKKQHSYFALVLYSTFALSAIRFTGVSGLLFSLLLFRI